MLVKGKWAVAYNVGQTHLIPTSFNLVQQFFLIGRLYSIFAIFLDSVNNIRFSGCLIKRMPSETTHFRSKLT